MLSTYFNLFLGLIICIIVVVILYADHYIIYFLCTTCFFTTMWCAVSKFGSYSQGQVNWLNGQCQIQRVNDFRWPSMTSTLLVWAELQWVHRGRGFGSKLAIHCKFINMKVKLDDFQKVAELIASRISRVKGIHFELEVVGVEVTNEDIILVLMSGFILKVPGVSFLTNM